MIVAQRFHDQEKIGAIRVQGLAKYLSEFGWEPVILTSKSSSRNTTSMEIIETNYETNRARWKRRFGLTPNMAFKDEFDLKTYKDKKTVVDYFIQGCETLLNYPDESSSWAKDAFGCGNSYLNNNSVDAIISSAHPLTCHLIAKRLCQEHQIPWIADFRDLWTQNHYYNHPWFRKVIERRLEVKTLKHASALTTVSQPLAETLAQIHKHASIYTIPNGFDPENTAPLDYPLSTKFCITYTGSLYFGKRDPEPLFEAIRGLILEGKIDPSDVVIRFYGYNEGWLQHEIEKYKLTDIARIYSPISREESIHRQRESQILLLLTWNNPAEIGVYTGKIFDYLSAKRPILSLGYPKGVVPDLLAKTNAGVHLTSHDQIKEQIFKWYRSFKQSGAVEYEGIANEINLYSQREMAQKFARILDRIR